MKRLLAILFLTVILTGCNDDAKSLARMGFPEVPKDLITACPELAQVDTNTTKLSEVVDVVIDNYSTYHECREKVNNWIDWYTTQQKIYNSVK